MAEPSNPRKPSKEDRPEDPLDDLLQAAFEPDPLDVPCRQDSVLHILKNMTASENRIRLQDFSDALSQPEGTSSPEISLVRGKAGRYKIISEIARGGLGVVMKSQDTDLGRVVAMKMLQDRYAYNSKMIRRLVEEAQIGGQLQHPGIVPVYEVGLQENQRPFFTMKLVKGKTLSELLKGRKDSGEDRMRFLRIFEQVCQTVAYAHVRGVIHRDLKPANIMVGSFGEVQLMDWGLAKVIGQSRERDENGAEMDHLVGSSPETLRTATGDRYSEAGSVMGTYGYMAPEQARGEGDQVDERSDVFGLGAILCVILTGNPPFVGEDPETIRQMAQEGKLGECWKRLEASGADPRMKTLAQRCLAGDVTDRPRNAGEVAEEMETYLAEVAERARRAELQTAESRVRTEEAEAKAKHERRAKRLGYFLAAAVVLAVVCGMLGYYWIETSRWQRIERSTKSVNDIVSQAVLLGAEARATGPGDLAAWSRALEKGREVVRLLRTAEVGPELKNRVDSLIREFEKEEALARKDHEMLHRLEDIRVQAGEHWDWRAMDREYAVAFRSYGIDIESLNKEKVVSLLKNSAIARELVGELDEWILARVKTGRDRQKLARIVLSADTDTWRNNLRQAWMRGDGEAVRNLAESRGLETLHPVDAHVLSIALTQANASTAAVSVLEATARNHPDDFLLNLYLGWTLYWSNNERLKDAIRYLWTAVALRPKSTAALNNLGSALREDGQHEAARSVIEKSLALDADNPRTLQCFGVFLYMVDQDYDLAILELERAVDLDPFNGGIHASLGRALHINGDLDRAITAYQHALELSPDYVDPKGNMALILNDKGDSEGALGLIDEILQVHPENALAHYNRGSILQSLGRPDQAAEAYRQAVRCNQNDAVWNYGLGSVLYRLGKWNEAKRYLMKAVVLDEEYAWAHYTLGCSFWKMGDLHCAKEHLSRALEISPDHIDARLDLGNVYHEEGKMSVARTCFEEVLESAPEHKDALYNLGNVHLALEDYDDAFEAYQNLTTISEDSGAWNKIGWIYMELGEVERAQQAFQNALAIDADHLLAQYNLAVALLDLGQYKDSLDAAQSTLGLAPEDRKGDVLNLIGDIRMRQGFLPEAEDSLREAIRQDWNAVEPRFQLANLLHELGRYEDAVQLFKETVAMDPDHQDTYIDLAFTYRSLGWFYDALLAMHRGHELGRFRPDWAHPSGQWVKECETMIEMNLRLDSYMKGQVTEDDSAKQILLALVCAARGFPVAAAGYFDTALSAQPELGDDVFRAYWFQAARAAVVASSGTGHDGGKLNEEERSRLRLLALDWLKNDLTVWEKTADKGNMGDFTIQHTFAVRKLHPDLHTIRDPDALASLPDDEREAFEEYWARVEDRLSRKVE